KHRREQEVARTIAGEHAARAVAAVGRRRQSHDQDASPRIAEARHRARPVRLVTKRGAFLAPDVLTPRDEPRTGRASGDLPLQRGEITGTNGHHDCRCYEDRFDRGRYPPGPMRVLLLVNPTASSVTPRKRAAIRRIIAAEHEVEVAETSRRGHATLLARAATHDQFDVVAVYAGDGTLNEAATGLVHTH